MGLMTLVLALFAGAAIALGTFGTFGLVRGRRG